MQEDARQTIYTDDVESYQRIAEMSPSAQVVVVDGKKKEKEGTQLHVFSYPEMQPLLEEPLHVEGDILSANFNSDGSLLAVATAKHVLIHKFKYDEKSKKVEFELAQTIGDPLIRKAPGASFRYAK